MIVKISSNITIDGVNYTAGQEVVFATVAEHDAFMAKLLDVIVPDEDKGTSPLIEAIKANEFACKEIYYKVYARQIKGGLLNQTLVKQRNIDTAMTPFMVPLYMGRVVGAIAGIAAVTAQTITNHSPFITANGLLKLRNELHDILNEGRIALGLPPIAPANSYNE